MAVAATLLFSSVAGLCLLLAYLIGHQGQVGLIAGYERGEYPEEIESQLARDVRNLLLISVALLCVFIVEVWIGPFWWAVWIFWGGLLLSITWVIWKYNIKY